MDKNLEQILRLYGELGPEEAPEDESLRVEFQRLASVKEALDARPRVAVPESAVRNVLALAREDRAPQTRPDRRPAARAGRRSRPLLAAAGSTLALVLAASLVFLLPSSDEITRSDSQPTASRQNVEAVPEKSAAGETSVADASSVSRPEPPVARAQPERSSSQTQAVRQPVRRAVDSSISEPVALTASRESTEPGLDWDDDDVRRLHMMINVLQGRGEEIDWESPAVPLELLPSAREGARRGVYQVSQPVPHR